MILQGDTASELFSDTFRRFATANGILIRASPPGHQHQNGKAENCVRVIKSRVRALMLSSRLRFEFWEHAINHACTIENLLPRTDCTANMSAYQKHFGTKPDALAHCPADFGAPCVALRLEFAAEHDMSSKPGFNGVYIGNSHRSRSFLVYNLETGRVRECASVAFVGDDHACPLSIDSISQAPPASLVKAEQLTSQLPRPQGKAALLTSSATIDEDLTALHEPDTAGFATPSVTTHDNHYLDRITEIDFADVDLHIASLLSSTTPSVLHPDDHVSGSAAMHEPPTRDPTSTAFITKELHTSMTSAMNDPLWHPYLKDAFTSEMQSMLEHHVWDLFPMDEATGRRLIGSKMMFSVKLNDAGESERFKARLCAKGFTQVAGIDYNATYSPTPHDASMRILLNIANQRGLDIAAADVSTAFLHGELSETIFMRLPPGIRTYNHRGIELIARLSRSLYGLKQSSRTWNFKLGEVLERGGYTRCRHDSSLFTKGTGKNMSYILTYVDDLLVVASRAEIDRLFAFLRTELKITSSLEADKFLGMTLTRDRRRQWITVSQQSLIEDLFADPEFKYLTEGLHTSRLSVPMRSEQEGGVFRHQDQPAPGKENFDLQRRYRRAVGVLLYVSVKTRPDLSYSVGRAATQMANPGLGHWLLLEQILRYAWHTRTTVLSIRTNGVHNDAGLRLTGYSDANWAQNAETRRSVSGILLMLNGNPIQWRSKGQTSVATAVGISETIAASECGKSIVHLRRLLSELGFPQRPATLLYVDNKSTVLAADHLDASPRLKHVAISDLYIRELTATDVAKVVHIAGTDNPADAFTKSLTGPTFKTHKSTILNQATAGNTHIVDHGFLA